MQSRQIAALTEKLQPIQLAVSLWYSNAAADGIGGPLAEALANLVYLLEESFSVLDDLEAEALAWELKEQQ